MPYGDMTSEVGLRDYLGALRRRRMVILSAVVLVTAPAMAATFIQRPVYEAKSQVLLQPRSAGSIFDPQARVGVDPARSAKTEIQVIESRPVRLAAQRRIRSSAGLDVSVRAVEGSDIIEISSRSGDPARAAAVANAFTRTYIEFRQKQAVEELLAGTGALQAKVNELQKQIDAIQANPRPAGGNQPGGGEAVRQVDPVLQSLIEQQALLKQRLDEAQVDSALTTGGAQVVAAATAPTSPIEPKPVRNAALALSAGLLFGVGLAFLVDHLDDAVRTREDLAAAAGIPVLGLVPVVPRSKARGGAALAEGDLSSPAGEAFRAIRTSLQLLALDVTVRKVLVTSPLGGDGKTTTVANLAVALARAGEKVAVMDCDLRRPRLHRLFGLGNEVGVTSVLLGEVELASALQAVPLDPNLRVLASGPMPPTAPELLSSKRTTELLDRLTSDGWVVLIDSPPLLPVTDAVVLARKVDAVVVVVNAGTTTKRHVQQSIELLRQVNPPVVAAVLNRAPAEPGYGSTYTYGYHYQPDPAPTDLDGTPRRGSRRARQRRAKAASRGPAARPAPIDDPGLVSASAIHDPDPASASPNNFLEPSAPSATSAPSRRARFRGRQAKR